MTETNILKHGFQAKTIRRVIRKKLDAWLESLPEEIRERIAADVLVTGGAPASMLIGEGIKDFDLYLRTKDSAILLTNHYVRRFLKFHPDTKIVPQVRVSGDRVRIHIQSSGALGEGGDSAYEYFEQDLSEKAAEEFLDNMEAKDGEKPKDPDPFRPVFLSENAISLSDKVQIVIRFYGELEDVHRNYDFEHCKCGYDYSCDALFTPESALLSLMARKLSYTGSLYPLCSLFRLRKFISRGWSISAGEILKIGFQVGELDLTNEEVLREQLIGVDMAYFSELLKIIADEKEKREGKSIDSAYITQLVDRVFNA